MKVVAIIEARMSSTRLPGKVLLPVVGQPLLQHLIQRLRKVPRLDALVVATTTNPADTAIVELTKILGVGCFRGSEEDVLGRVLGAADSMGAEVIVEITGDCPLIDPAIVQQGIEHYLQGGFDYVSNLFPRTHPIGLDTQIFSTEVLREVERTTHNNPLAREHVSLPIYEQPTKFRLGNFLSTSKEIWPELALTLDTAEDYKLIRAIFEQLGPISPDLSHDEVIKFLLMRPDLVSINKHIQRKEIR